MTTGHGLITGGRPRAGRGIVLDDPGSAEIVSDYGSFDYRALWKGRATVTSVESGLLHGLLIDQDVRRLVELGTGFGRLTPMLAGRAEEYFGVDFDPGHLIQAAEAARRARRGLSPPRMILANLYHLPFAEGSFTSEVLVRVFHHLSEPKAILSALSRRLITGGRLFLTYNPRPSLVTFALDVRRAISRKEGEPFVSVTFARGGPVIAPADPFPVYVDTARAFRAAANAAGLEIEREFGYGLEEYARSLPPALFIALGRAIRPSGLHASRMASIRRSRVGAPQLCPSEALFVCPRCTAPLRTVDLERPTPVECVGCGWRSSVTAGFNDLRYMPPDTSVRGPPVSTGPAHATVG
jgi:SAM-dependent methyltransferase